MAQAEIDVAHRKGQRYAVGWSGFIAVDTAWWYSIRQPWRFFARGGDIDVCRAGFPSSGFDHNRFFSRLLQNRMTKRFTNDRPSRMGGCLLSIFLFTSAAGCSHPVESDSTVVRPVKTMVVTAGGELRERSFPGKVEASRRVELAFQVPGLIVNLPVKEGQRVAEGELIAQLREDEFKARLTSLQGQLDQSRAALDGVARENAPRSACGAKPK